MERTFASARPGPWVGYAAAAWAFAFAVPSFVWGSGSHIGVRAVSRDFATYTWTNHAGFQAFILFTACLKVIGGLFALALVRPSWPLPPRRLTIIGGYTLAAILVVYGLQDIVLPTFMETHAISIHSDADWYAIRWHLWLWGPYFALWGVLLGLAVRNFQQGAATSR